MIESLSQHLNAADQRADNCEGIDTSSNSHCLNSSNNSHLFNTHFSNHSLSYLLSLTHPLWTTPDCKALLKSTTEQHAENAKSMMMEMSDQLAQESERLLSERKKHERMYAEMLVQVGELQKLLSAQRTEAAGRFAEAVKSKDQALQRVAGNTS